MKSTLVDGLPYHPQFRHRNGQRLRALTIVNGSPLWPVMGSDGDDDGSEGDDSDSDGDKDSDKDGDGDKDKGTEKPKEESALAKLQNQFEAIKKQLSESDKKKAAAEKKISELESKDLSDLEKAKKDLAEKEAEGAKLSGAFRQLAIDNAFLKASQRLKIQWHDPDVAQAAAKLGSLEIGDDGTVEGIDDAVKNLAKASPFLVNKGTKEEDEEADGKDKKGVKKGASGSGVGSGQNGGKGKGTTPSEEEIRRRFPALRK